MQESKDNTKVDNTRIMKYRFGKAVLLMLLFVCGALNAQAQNYNLKIKLIDNSNGEPLGYATVAVTPDGKTAVLKYAQSAADGTAEIKGIPAGKYKVEAILMGYDNYEEVVTINKHTDLGTKEMKVQANFLEGATVTSVGNPITVKKDTITHNVSMLKSSDNDVLEDLLKRLPGVEVSSDGTITANGKTISKIQIDGKQFFLDDPSIASKNLPANIIERVSVVEKKSEQAEFTGIDDGEEETVLDLGVKKGMMKGWFGNVMGGAGYDLQGAGAVNDARYQAAAMVANFTESQQLAFIGNANNTNNRGFNDLAASSMGDMRGGMRGGMGGMGGGWGGNGISSSYMTGFNGGYTWKNKSEIVGNAMFNGNERYVEEKSLRNTPQKDGSNIYTGDEGFTRTSTWGVRAGARADWKVSENTSLLFEPNFNIGWGDFEDRSDFTTDRGIDNVISKVNDGHSASYGESHSQRANARILWRQRLGKPGRTLSFNARLSYSNTDMEGYNESVTRTFDLLDELAANPVYSTDSTVIDQKYDRVNRSTGANARISYTEPLGNNFFLEANYSYNYTLSKSTKDTYDKGTGGYNVSNIDYSSDISNAVHRQSAGFNFRKQEKKFNATVGASIQPQTTINSTQRGVHKLDTTLKVLNWSPNARIDFNFSDYRMLRLNYRGQSTQPTLSQMMPVPDNSNPQRVTLGNMGLTPSFSHNLFAMYNNTNRETFASLNANVNLSYRTNNIVTASWSDDNGVQYNVPVNNDKGAWSASSFLMYNTPVAKSKFSVMSFTNIRFSTGVSMAGSSNIDPSDESSYLNMDNYALNDNQTLNIGENLRVVYRGDIVETSLGGGTRYSQSWNSIVREGENKNNGTWTSNVDFRFIAKVPDIINVSTDARYTFYNGYGTGYNDPKLVWNAEVSKQLFKNKFTLSVKAYDILNQSRNTYVNYANGYEETVQNNTLGRYIMASLTYRFGNFGGQRGGGMRGSGGRPGMGGPRRF